MKLVCSRCHGNYRIPGDQIPTDNSVVVWCPKCRDVMGSDEHNGSSFTEREGSPTHAKYGETLKKEMIASFKKLCPMPHVMLKARQLLEDDKSDFRQLGKIMRADQALASRILKVANSAFYGMKGRVSSLQHASALIGNRMLTQIITLVSTSKMMGGSLPGYGLQSGSLWRHSLRVAVGAEIIGRRVKMAHQGEAFITGLLHDAGKVILDHQVIQQRSAFDAFTGSDPTLMVYAEQMIFGFDHTEIGKELCRKWHLPEIVAEGIAFHHFPGASQANPLAYAVHLADRLAAEEIMQGQGLFGCWTNDGILRFLDLTDSDLPEIIAEISEAGEALEEDTM